MPKVQRSPLGSKTQSVSEPNVDKLDTLQMELFGNNYSPSYVQHRQKRAREHGLEDEFSSFKKEIKDMIKSLFSEQQKELKKITSVQSEIKESNTNIESSLAFLSAQNEDLRNKIEQFEVELKREREQITILEDKIEDLQREQRKANIEIKNMPKQPTESKDDLIHMVVCLSKSLNSGLKKEDIKDIYRLKGRRDVNKPNTPIIVELSSAILKNDIIKSGKIFNIKNKEKLRAKHLGANRDEETAVFLSEQLTTKGARLHFVARDLAKSKGYKFCWTAYGRVYIRKDENSPVIVVRNESQIQSLMQA